MTIEQIQAKLDNHFQMKSVYKSERRELIYNSPANIPLLYVRLYKNKQGEYRLSDVFCPNGELYTQVYYLVRGGAA